jgi:hypothetical protein
MANINRAVRCIQRISTDAGRQAADQVISKAVVC